MNIIEAVKMMRHQRLERAEPDLSRPWKPDRTKYELDLEHSFRVQKKVRAGLGACWFNSRRLVLKHAGYENASYVEGFVIYASGFSDQHGWVVHNGVILDPTLPEQGNIYFPGLQFRGKADIERFLAGVGRGHKKKPFHWAFGWGGGESESYMRAHHRWQLTLSRRATLR